jgi:hypothetical protein
MASLGFKDIAHQAVASAFVFGITQMETPKYRYLPRISSHCLDEGPQKHDKKYMEHSKQS